MLMLRHVLQEWIAPLGDDGNADAFSHGQLLIMESWVELLARNLPDAFGLADPLQELQRALLQRVRASQTPEGSSLCADEWKLLTAPVLTRIAEVGQRDFVVASACASDTCRMWSLLHTLASEGFRREQWELSSNSELILSPSSPDVTLSYFNFTWRHMSVCTRRLKTSEVLGRSGGMAVCMMAVPARQRVRDTPRLNGALFAFVEVRFTPGISKDDADCARLP